MEFQSLRGFEEEEAIREALKRFLYYRRDDSSRRGEGHRRVAICNQIWKEGSIPEEWT